MTIRHGCFFSYAHGQHAYMSKFKDDLVDALKCYLGTSLRQRERTVC